MARPMRSAISIAQCAQCLPGPSSLRAPLRPVIARAAVPSVRSASFFGFDKWAPDFLRPKRKARDLEGPASTASPTRESETSVVIPESEISADQSTGSLFDEIVEEIAAEEKKKKATEHGYSTAFRKISQRKLNLLSRQIAGLPIDEAIVQMQFSDKRAGTWIKSTLCLARDHAINKGMDRAKLVVAESWTAKGTKIKRIDIKGRGRAGIKHHPTARLHVLLREGKTKLEKQQIKFKKEVNLVRSAGLVREDEPLRRKVVSGWAW